MLQPDYLINSRHYKITELTMPASKANVRALLFIVPVLAVFIVAYILLWPEQLTTQRLLRFWQMQPLPGISVTMLLLLLMLPGAVVHELLHGLTWAMFCKNGLGSIKFGVNWKSLSPYCHCLEVLPLWPYMLGGMMPGLVMGLLPAIVGLILGNLLIFIIGLLFILAAAADALSLWMLRYTSKDALVQDHPDLLGCIVYQKLE
jgi:hypothetical protein